MRSIDSIIDFFAIIDSVERKYAEIPKHEDTEYHTYSDIGCYLINGLLFRNYFGDGVNKVIVRKFENKVKYYTKAEILGMLNELKDAGIYNLLALRGDRNPDIEPKKEFLYFFLTNIDFRKGKLYNIYAVKRFTFKNKEVKK